MQKQISFTYRKLIDSSSNSAWSKLVFEDSYLEFRLQVQNFTDHLSHPEWRDLQQVNPKAKELPFRIQPSILPYIQQLNHFFPDITDELGRRFLPIENFQLELINSHFRQIEKHQIALVFKSSPFIWHETVNDLLIISAPSKSTDKNFNTHTLKLSRGLSISQLSYIT